MNSNNISCTTNSIDPCRHSIEINIPAEEVNSVFRDVESTFVNYAKLPGFRQGKIPHNLIKQRFASKITEEVRQQLIRESLEAAIEQCEEKPITMPTFAGENVDSLKENHPFTYNVEFDVAPKVILPNYKDIKIDLPESEPSEKEVNDALEIIRAQRATYEKVNLPASKNDMLKVSYSSDLPDEDIPESAAKLLTTEETWLILAEPEILPGIIDGLDGSSEGSKVDLNVSFPDSFHENFLSGKSISYTIQVLEVHSSKIPELDDDFAKSLGTDSLSDLKTLMKQQITIDKMTQSKLEIRDQINSFLLKETPSIPLPQKILEQEKYYTLVSKIMKKREQNPYVRDEEIAEDKEELQKNVNEEAEDRLRLNYIVQEIANQENIEIANDEIESYFDNVKDDYKRQARKQNRKFDADELKLKIGANLLNSKVFEKLIEYSQANNKNDDK